MSNELIRPNWHVILIHYPLALLGVGLLIEIFSFLWRRGTIRIAGRWMILLGAVLSVPAATSGIYAFRDVVVSGPAEPSLAWSDLVSESHWSAEQWSLMKHHVIYAGVGTAVIALSLLTWLAVSDATRRPAHWLLVLVALAGLVCLSSAAWYSGEAIYRHGTAVELPRSGHAEEASDSAGKFNVKRVLPPLQVHIALAGLTVAVALVALGLSLHWWNHEKRTRADQLKARLAAEQGGAPEIPVAGDRLPPDAESVEAEAIIGGSARMPFPARYWLLALLFGAATFVTGLWQADDWKFQALSPDSWHDERRVAWHTVLGLTIAAVVLLLTLLTGRLFRRWRLIGYAVGTLLVLTVAAQLALGTLMLFDSTTGPLFGLQPPEPSGSATPPATQP